MAPRQHRQQIEILIKGVRRSVPLLKEEVVVGRGLDVDVQVDDINLSRKHLKIIVKPGDIRIMDLGSANGSYLNGVRLTALCALPYSPGDELWLADHIAQVAIVEELEIEARSLPGDQPSEADLRVEGDYGPTVGFNPAAEAPGEGTIPEGTMALVLSDADLIRIQPETIANEKRAVKLAADIRRDTGIAAQLASQVERLTEELRGVQRQMDTARANRDTLALEIATIQPALKQAKRESQAEQATLQAEIAREHDRCLAIRQLSQDEAKRLEQMRAAQAAVDSSQQEAERLRTLAETARDHAETQRRTIETKRRELEVQISRVTQTQSEIQQNNDHLQAETARLRAELETLKSKRQATLADLDKFMAWNVSERQKIRAGTEDALTQKTVAEKQVLVARAQITLVEREAAEARSNLVGLRTDMDDAKARRNQVEQEARAVFAQQQQTLVQVEKLLSQKSELQDEHATLSTKLTQLRIDFDNAQRQWEQAQAEATQRSAQAQRDQVSLQAQTLEEIGTLKRNAAEEIAALKNAAIEKANQLTLGATDEVARQKKALALEVAAQRQAATDETSALRQNVADEVTALKQAATDEVTALKQAATQEVTSQRQTVAEEVAGQRRAAAEEVANLTQTANDDATTLRQAATEEVAAQRQAAVDEMAAQKLTFTTEFTQAKESLASDVKRIRQEAEDNAAQSRRSVLAEIENLKSQSYAATNADFAERARKVDLELTEVRNREMDKLALLTVEFKNSVKARKQRQIQDVSHCVESFMVTQLTHPSREKLTSDLIAQLKKTLVESDDSSSTGQVMVQKSEAAQVAKRYWFKVAGGAAAVVMTAGVLITFPTLPGRLTEAARRGLASGSSSENDVFLRQIKQQNRKYEVAREVRYRDTYADNVLYAQSYAEMKAAEEAQKSWILRLNDFIVKGLGLSDRVIVEFSATESGLVGELLAIREGMTEQFKEVGITKMKTAETMAEARMVSLLSGRDNYGKFRDFERAFYMDYLAQHPPTAEVPTGGHDENKN